jgi:acetyltransferase-like isoleucine patch superfamily enzyme
MLSFIKTYIKYKLLKKKFKNSVIHFGAAVDDLSFLSQDTVLFRDTVIQKSTIGKRTYIQKNSVITCAVIGNYCSIASDVHIGLANHPTSMVSTSPVFYDNSQPLPFFFAQNKFSDDLLPRTLIGSDVWIGQGVIIKSGLKIGNGAIIAAGAVVTSDVENYSVVGGVPAKHIKWRFSAEVRDALASSEWWSLDDDLLKRLSPFFKDPEILISKINAIIE